MLGDVAADRRSRRGQWRRCRRPQPERIGRRRGCEFASDASGPLAATRARGAPSPPPSAIRAWCASCASRRRRRRCSPCDDDWRRACSIRSAPERRLDIRRLGVDGTKITWTIRRLTGYSQRRKRLCRQRRKGDPGRQAPGDRRTQRDRGRHRHGRRQPMRIAPPSASTTTSARLKLTHNVPSAQPSYDVTLAAPTSISRPASIDPIEPVSVVTSNGATIHADPAEAHDNGAELMFIGHVRSTFCRRNRHGAGRRRFGRNRTMTADRRKVAVALALALAFVVVAPAAAATKEAGAPFCPAATRRSRSRSTRTSSSISTRSRRRSTPAMSSSSRATAR